MKKASRKQSMTRRIGKKQLQLCLMISPAILLLFIFYYIPLGYNVISFQRYEPFRGIKASQWIGLSNYIYFLTDDKFWSVLKNTLIINTYDLVFGFSAPIFFALLVNEIHEKYYKRFIQTISYLPNFISWVVVAGIFSQVLSPTEGGLLNKVLFCLFGMEPVAYMTNVKLFRGILVVADIWKNMGWSAILYFATIASVDSGIYEAANIDGAGRLKQAFHVTLPHMYPIITLMFLLKLSSIFTIGFDRIFLMQNPLVLSVSDVISTYIYRVGLQQSHYGLTTAIGLVQSLLGFTLLVIANNISKKVIGYGLY